MAVAAADAARVMTGEPLRKVIGMPPVFAEGAPREPLGEVQG